MVAAVCALLFAGLAQAQTYFARTTGGSTTNWSQNTTWSTANCTGAAAAGIPGAGNAVQICNGKTVNVNITTAVAASVTVNAGNAASTLNINAGQRLAVGGNTTIPAPTGNITKLISVQSGGELAVGGALSLTGGNSNLRIAQLSVIGGTVTVTGNTTLTAGGGTARARMILSGGAAAAVSIGGALALNAPGSIDNGSGTISVGGNFTHSGTYTASTGTFRFNGAGAQSLLGTATPTTFYNLTVNKSGGDLTLGHNADLATNGTLTLTQGRVTTGAFRLYVGQNGVISGGGTGSYVRGNLLRYVGLGNSTLAWPVGGTLAGSYSPLTLAFNNVTTPGNVQAVASLAAGDHPNIATSDLDAARSLNRFWTVTNVTPIVFTSADATFGYQGSDADAAAIQTGFAAGRFAAATWTYPDTGTASAGSLPVTGLDSTTFAGAFALAERRAFSNWQMNQAAWNGTANEVLDTAAAANHGTAASLGGGTPTTAGGPPASCRYGAFTRARKDYVALPAGYPNISTGSFSITGWIRTTDNTQASQRIFVDDENNAGGWALSLGDAGTGTVRFFSRGSSTLIVDTGAAVANNAWYFVGASVRIVGTTTTVNLYVYDLNGTLTGSGTGTAAGFTWGVDAGPPSIGGETNASGEGTAAFGFSGSLDEIRVYRAALTASQVNAVRQAFTPCMIIDHFAITGNATGVSCSPESVTITAHDAAHFPVLYTGTVNVSTSSLRGDWSQVSGGSGFSNGAADDGQAAINFSNESAVTLSLKHTWAGVSNINVLSGAYSEGTGAATAGDDLSITWSHAGFVFTDASVQNIANQVAGATSPTYLLRSVLSTGCVPGGSCTGACSASPDFANGTNKTVELAFECENPSTCAGGVLTVTNNGASGIAGNDNVAGIDNILNWTGKSLSWGADATASFTFSYADVGQLKLHARYALTPSGEYIKGSSAAFVVKPFGLTVTGITRSDNSANPAASDASGSRFVRAGEAFKLTVTATNQAGAATPNFGREIAPEGVTLTAALAGGLGLTDIPALTNGVIAGGSFTAGVASVTNVAWDEVGIITLTPTVTSGNYLGAGAVTGTASGNIGRFVPDRLALLTSPAPTLANRVAAACASTFSYLGEPIGLEFTLEAQNAAGVRTRNYRSSGTAAQNFAKLDFSNASQFGFGALSGASNLSTRVAEGLSGPLRYFVNYPTWIDGRGAATAGLNTSARLRVQRNNSGPSPQDNPDGPHASAQFGIRAADADAVALSALDMDLVAGGGNDHKNLGVSTTLRFGRLRCQNAAGSDKLALPMQFEAQYWNGTAFTRNVDDSCTTVSVGDVSYSGYRNFLSSGELGAPTVTALASGLGRVLLPKPSGGDGNYVGGLNVTFDLATPGNTYLSGNWSAVDGDAVPSTAYDDNPSCSATFGLYGSQPRQFIFFRENY